MQSQIDQIEEMIRQAVHEVFGNMVSMSLADEKPAELPEDPSGQVAGSVGFIGEATGVIYLYVGARFAGTITGRLLSIPETEIEGEEMINDAIGELSNMVGGYVKSRLSDGGYPCTLTIPSIVRGKQLTIEGVTDVARRMIGFSHEGNHLQAELLIKEDEKDL
jgi:chemotaxis protein CheX